MEQQELVDRLVTAVAEGDVLYTLYWIKEMEKAGILEESLHAERAFTPFFPPYALYLRDADLRLLPRLVETTLGSCGGGDAPRRLVPKAHP
jgi:hypothetical protein